MIFYRFHNDHYLTRKRIVDTDVVNDVTATRKSVITRVVIRFLDTTLSTDSNMMLTFFPLSV